MELPLFLAPTSDVELFAQLEFRLVLPIFIFIMPPFLPDAAFWSFLLPFAHASDVDVEFREDVEF